MKHIIIGTAGHIDHGKTTLIKALTGRNTDRWKEEQKRGITIDLGFTYFNLKNGNVAGVIDVPGHEKFINNMVAGVVGMDLVLLVVAADEGIMPQTREHMDILNLLGIKKSILVINKCDLVDEDYLEIMEEDIKSELKGTFLENAPVARVSASTGFGIEELKDLIEKVSEEDVEEKDIHTIPRLPIDRVFSISGFGTIVTGTLISGTISKDDVLEMYPSNKESKIRNIQVHGENADKCYAGQRVALNISNLKKNEVKRGCTLAPVGSMKSSKLVDVKLKILNNTDRIIKNNTRLHFFSGTTEVLCRAVLLGNEKLEKGEEGYVQLRMEEEVALRRGDRFVVRFYSPLETVGGGVVLEPNAFKKKRFVPEVIEGLKQKEKGTAEDVIELHVKDYGETLVSVSELAKITAMSVDEVKEAVDNLKKSGNVCAFEMKKDVYVWHGADELEARREIIKKLGKYASKYPYRFGMLKAELHTGLLKKIKINVFTKYMDYLEELGVIKSYNEFVAEASHEIVKDDTFNNVRRALLGGIKPAKYDFIKISTINFRGIPKETVDDILVYLTASGEIVKLADDVYTLKKFMDNAVVKVTEVLKENGKITIGEVRDMFNTSRKSAKPIVEYMDRIKITKQSGKESERLSNL